MGGATAVGRIVNPGNLAAKSGLFSDMSRRSCGGQVMLRQADDLGVGVYKKRLSKNLYRSVILAKGGRYWVFVYLFAKKDRANIDDEELASFRALADLYARKTDVDIAKEVHLKELVEIFHD